MPWEHSTAGLSQEIPFEACEAATSDQPLVAMRLQLCSRVYFCCTSLIDSVVSPTSGK